MMISLIFAVVFLHLTSGIDEFYFCDKDPCIQGNTFVLQSKQKRTPNCPNLSDNLCDAYISDGWYRGPAPILKRCTNINTCGTVFPIWMNGTDPTIEEGVVSRNACLSGPKNCCQKVYKIKVKRCDTFIAYCLPHTGSCPERYCFGDSGNCTVPTTTTKSTTTSTTTTTTTASTTTTSTIPTTMKPTIADKRRPNEGSDSKIPGEHSYRTDDLIIDLTKPDTVAFLIAILISVVVALGAILYCICKWNSKRKKSYKPSTPDTKSAFEDKASAKWCSLWLDN